MSLSLRYPELSSGHVQKVGTVLIDEWDPDAPLRSHFLTWLPPLRIVGTVSRGIAHRDLETLLRPC